MSFTKALLLMLVGLATIRSAQAQTYTVLYAFTGKADGNGPFGGLVRDSAGNLYGTTIGGGDGLYPNGTVFKLSFQGQAHAPPRVCRVPHGRGMALCRIGPGLDRQSVRHDRRRRQS